MCPQPTASGASSLMRPGSWRLLGGMAALPAVRVVGEFFLCGCGLLCLAWAIGVGQDVQRGGRSIWVLPLCVLLVGLAFRQLFAAWGRWHADPTLLTLTWAGPVRSDPSAGGWMLGDYEGGVPADVCALLDLQLALLCRVRIHGSNKATFFDQWCWLTPSRCMDMHRLRALLALPAQMSTTLYDDAEPLGRRRRESASVFRPTQAMARPRLSFRPSSEDQK